MNGIAQCLERQAFSLLRATLAHLPCQPYSNHNKKSNHKSCPNKRGEQASPMRIKIWKVIFHTISNSPSFKMTCPPKSSELTIAWMTFPSLSFTRRLTSNTCPNKHSTPICPNMGKLAMTFTCFIKSILKGKFSLVNQIKPLDERYLPYTSRLFLGISLDCQQ